MGKDTKLVYKKPGIDQLEPVKVKIPNDLAKVLGTKSHIECSLTRNMMSFEFECLVHSDNVKKYKDTIIKYLRTKPEDLGATFELSMVTFDYGIYLCQQDVVFEVTQGAGEPEDDKLTENVTDEELRGILTRDVMHNDATLECKVVIVIHTD